MVEPGCFPREIGLSGFKIVADSEVGEVLAAIYQLTFRSGGHRDRNYRLVRRTRGVGKRLASQESRSVGKFGGGYIYLWSSFV